MFLCGCTPQPDFCLLLCFALLFLRTDIERETERGRVCASACNQRMYLPLSHRPRKKDPNTKEAARGPAPRPGGAPRARPPPPPRRAAGGARPAAGGGATTFEKDAARWAGASVSAKGSVGALGDGKGFQVLGGG